ncbi:hypothetical protein OWR29_25520 [Actinoplanes sp. Pm04-4]|uniref:ADP ribosyltransferase domain-containing protein n=1 Tax=Paractinoplanes pyxinae TaxID=2997416 RepID=A0ABT4B5R1_9ACTN|nr:phage minor capsid protein [Actinoplanes pyxinae]MCY1141372.1 hypothetical protein [Actinoplanes pyxinae]
MAVSPDKLAAIVQATADLYRDGEDGLLRLLTRYLAKGIDTPDWALQRLLALQQLRGAANAILDRIGDELAATVLAAVDEAYAAGDTSVLGEIPNELAISAGAAAAAEVPRSDAMQALARGLVDDFGQRHNSILRRVDDVYRQVVASATASSIAGGLTRREAAQLAYARLVEQGVASFTDRRGRRWRMSSYVEMALRTVTQRAAVQGQVDRQTRLGLPFVVVSNAAEECERCRPYEGRVLRIDSGPIGSVQATSPATGEQVTVTVKATLDAARSAGFQHPNCRHAVRSYLPGVTQPPEQPTADPTGDEARQRQRAIERNIRRWKERELTALTPEAKAAATGKVKAWQGAMRDHLAANPTLKRLSYREQIGAGNVPKKAIPPVSRPATAPKKAQPAKPPAPAKPKAAPKPAEVKTTKASYDDRLKTAAAGDDALAAPKRSLIRTDTHARPGRKDGLTVDQRNALSDYQASNDFRMINVQLHDVAAGRTPLNEPRALDQIRHIDEAMAGSPLDRSVVVWRGFRRAKRTFGDRADGDLTGAEWTEPAYLSATSEERVTKDFAHTTTEPVVMRIIVPKGTKGIHISNARDEQGYPDEAEILLNRGMRLRVVADYGIVGSVRRIDVEVIS